MNITYNKNTTSNNELDTVSIGSEDLTELSFEDEQSEGEKTPKECFKTIYGTGAAADRIRLLI